ncbi:MAG: hypothetical protein ACYS0I_18480 [Planctomycetota bacterium]
MEPSQIKKPTPLRFIKGKPGPYGYDSYSEWTVSSKSELNMLAGEMAGSSSGMALP